MSKNGKECKVIDYSCYKDFFESFADKWANVFVAGYLKDSPKLYIAKASFAQIILLLLERTFNTNAYLLSLKF